MTANIEMTVKQTSLTMSAGEKAEITVSLRNKGQTVDQFSLKIEGMDPAWYALPVSSVALFPNDTDNLKIILNLPEKLVSNAPSYTLHILAASQENTQETASASVVIQIKTAPKAEVSIAPQRSAGKKGTYQITINNPGSSEMKVQLKPQDAAGKLKYTLQPEMFTVPANNHVDAILTSQLKLLPYIFGGEKDFDFQVTAVCPDEPSAETCGEVRGTLLNEPWYKPLAKLRIPWLSRPPQIISFDIKTDDKHEYKLTWVTKKGSQIKLDGADVEAKGENVVRLTEDKQFVLVATNKYGTATKTVEAKPLPLPKAKSLSRIKLSISQSQLMVQAGGSPVQINVDVQNLGEIVDKFLVEVEGLDESWYTRSASSIALMPKAADQVQLSFQPPKKKGVKSGLYPFGVTVRSQSVAGESATVVGQLEILPAVEYKMKVQPYRIAASKKAVFRVNLANINVTQASFKLEATDLEENCDIVFENNAPIVAAWNTIDVPMTVKPKVGRAVGELRRFDITVTATPSEGLPQTANCEFTHQPRLKNYKWVIRLIKLAVVIIVALVALYFIFKLGGGWDTFVHSPKTWFNNAANLIEGWFSR
jgi:hypothetical protein